MMKAIDRLFQRLAATYGAGFDRSLGSTPVMDAKSAWAYELTPFKNHLYRVAWALDNLPDKCPNVIEFKKLCRLAPELEQPKLPDPKADPARLAAEIAKLEPLRNELAKAPARVDFKEWAKVIIANPKGRSPTAVQMARNALENT